MNFSKTFSILLMGSILTVPQISFAAKSYGRFTFGGYAATERFKSIEYGSDTNDELVFSSRLYNKIFQIGDDKWEFVSDIRDKHDFFDKLDKERLLLTDRNELQVRQLNSFWKLPDGPVSLSVGRFPVQDVGAVYTDGLMAEYRLKPNLWATVFGGKNPQIQRHASLTFNSNANISGLGLTYQARSGDWVKNFYLTNGLVTQSYGSAVDRNFIYHQMNYQWDEHSRILSLLYLDFVPRTYIQNANLLWQQEYQNDMSAELGLLAIDSIEYYRNQSLRETLPSSPYREAHGRLTFGDVRDHRWVLGLSSGQRSYDGKSKSEYSISRFDPHFFSRNWDFYAKVGGRKNFVSNDIFLKMGSGFYSRKWELNFDFEYAGESFDDGSSLHPVIADFSAALNLSKAMALTGSFQAATDEKLTIYTTFLKLIYKYGEQENAPQRDGALLRGPI